MQREVIDGVPVLWSAAPGPLEAALVFGHGASDETFRTIGVTHLVEHLAMSTLPRLHHEHNASVSLTVTDFSVSGTDEQVVDFLAAVCKALAALPVDRIEREAGVLAAEASGVIDPVTAELLSARYGTVGAGLASWGGPGPDRIAVEAVRETVARSFHAGNAVLLLTGPPPPALRLPLPPGERPERGGAQPVMSPGPHWVVANVPGPGLALHADLDGAALTAAHAVLQERLRQVLRHREGLSYDVDGARVHTGGGLGEFTVVVDARAGQQRRVAEILWREALRLAAEGMTEAELAEEVAGFREVWLDPRALPAELGQAGACLLSNIPYQDATARLDALAAVDPDGARQAFAAALRTALLVVPEDVEVELAQPDGAPLTEGGCAHPRGGELPSGGRHFKPPMFARLRFPQARTARLVLTDDAVWSRDGRGDVHHLPFADVVGVEVNGPGRVLFGRGNCATPVVPELFAGIGEAVAAIDAGVPKELHYELSAFAESDEDEGEAAPAPVSKASRR
ncbi:insulinase family protein [Streptomyces sp. NPDC047315]|uniref:insulinase family protein n=1 Tax=Streptomyces sp. NPDC047315 TaxID=3155142 RepID=UPI0033DC48BC